MDATCTTAAATNSSAATKYCSSSDSVCSTCTVSSSKPTCTGEDGTCICPSLCEIVSSSSSSSSDCSTSTKFTSSDSQHFSMMYVAVAFGALSIMIMLYMQRKFAERRVEQHISLVRQEMESRREQRRREREMLRARRPELALNLETWRDHVELHKPQMSKVELETCYYLMMQDDKKKSGKKDWESASEGEVKVGIGAVSSPISSGVSDPTSLHSPVHVTAPYFAMREEYPSNTTTDGSDSGSEIASVADEDEEKPDVAIDVDQPASRR
ncbi:unnamed protein product [Phytophthora lilii]|uniref:Unnamed protein product n=1 Tax=Phytophthora lilii TaxID=2077276 RepID=A0A9W6TVE9_9STRA|nr:unnamed protein product [Phytophthora lilii]